jgi:hypothetical protein
MEVGMSTITAPRIITSDEATSALLDHLGSGYRVTAGGANTLTVKHGALAFAHVRIGRAGEATTFRVHGGGLILGRLVNELGIARTVASALREEYGSAA